MKPQIIKKDVIPIIRKKNKPLKKRKENYFDVAKFDILPEGIKEGAMVKVNEKGNLEDGTLSTGIVYEVEKVKLSKLNDMSAWVLYLKKTSELIKNPYLAIYFDAL